MDIFFLGHRHSVNTWIERRATAVNAAPVPKRRLRRSKRVAPADRVVWANEPAAGEQDDRAHRFGLGSPAT